MDQKDFHKAIQTAASKAAKTEKALTEKLLSCLGGNSITVETDELLGMTRLSILIEGFCKSLSVTSTLKSELLAVKLKRWRNHYGTPTVPFLLTFEKQISETIAFFQDDTPSVTPWIVNRTENLIADTQNNVLIAPRITSTVTMPAEKEKTGQFLKTNNPSGGFTTTPCDIYSQKFIEQTAANTKQRGIFLEIGAAFGAASLQALKHGATVFCNDIEPKNLAVIYNRHKEENSKGELVLIPGEFPEELSALPKNHFDAILICRVLHFFPGIRIEKALKQLSALLKQGGKLYIVCETPFLKNWQNFIPEHEKRMAKGIEWPGEITAPAEFESSGRAASLPQFVHWISKEILDRSLMRASFKIIQSSYIDRNGQFPSDLILDGKESVGAIAEKQLTNIFLN